MATEISLTRSRASKARKTKSGGRNGGRPKIAERCPCGLLSATLAAKRGHKCDPVPYFEDAKPAPRLCNHAWVARTAEPCGCYDRKCSRCGELDRVPVCVPITD